MAKKKNKSALIREYLAKHPDASPSEVTKALVKKGVNIRNVYSTTSYAKHGKPSSARPIGKTNAVGSKRPVEQKIAIQDLKRTTEFIQSFRTPAQAQSAIQLVMEIMNT